MASTKRNTLSSRPLLSGCASSLSPAIACRCGTRRSTRFRHSAPAKMPPITRSSESHPPSPRAGRIRPTIEAQSITPAAKPSTISLKVCEIFLKINPSAAPASVAPPTPSAVNKTSSISISLHSHIRTQEGPAHFSTLHYKHLCTFCQLLFFSPDKKREKKAPPTSLPCAFCVCFLSIKRKEKSECLFDQICRFIGKICHLCK